MAPEGRKTRIFLRVSFFSHYFILSISRYFLCSRSYDPVVGVCARANPEAEIRRRRLKISLQAKMSSSMQAGEEGHKS